MALSALNMIPCYLALENFKYLKLTSKNLCQSNFLKTSLIYPVFINSEERIPNFKIETFKNIEKRELVLGKTIKDLYAKSSLLAVTFWHSVVSKHNMLEAQTNLKKIICYPQNQVSDFNNIEKFNFFPDDLKPAIENTCIN